MKTLKKTLSMLLAVCMVISLLCLPVLAVEIATKPENGTTEGQPFPIGAGGSNNFRIPGIVTLDDGTLIAACDARWNHTGDGAGLDTIVAVSHDNGATWEHTFANYLGDNGNTYNNLSTCIIDPAIGTDGTTAYLIADLFPAGIALNTSKYAPMSNENGFDDDGHLMLRALADDTIAIGESGYNTMAGVVSRYTYYLDLATLQLYAYGTDGAEDTLIEGYTVDAYFNIVSDDGTVDTNLFFSDSPYQPYPTDYLYLVTSEDGLNWSLPTLLNLQEDGEQTLLIGPGNGTYDAANDRMIFTAYEYTSGYQRTSLLWKDSDGNWKRTADATNSTWSSEATSVVLADGTVRCFYRDGYSYLRYTDFVWDETAGNYVPDTAAYEVTTLATKTYNNQISAIKYSEQIDGKDAILVSTANTSTNSRRNGTLYVFLVAEDNSMELVYEYDMFEGTDDYYAYSCITEMDDGNIALLYEGDDGGSGYGRVIFHEIKMADVVTRDNDARLNFVEFELLTGQTYTYTDNTGYYGDADLSELDTSVATVEISGGETTTNAAQVLSTGANIDLDACQYTFTADGDYFVISNTLADGTTVYLNHYLSSGNNAPNITTPGPIAVTNGTVNGMFRLEAQVQTGGSGVARGLHFHAESSTPYWNRCGSDTSYKCQEYLFRKAADGETSSTEIPGYVQITSIDDVVDGGQYLIAAKNDAGNWYVLNPTTSTTSLDHVAQIMGSTTIGYTDLVFTGVGAGYTEVQVGSTVYKITVADLSTVEVTVPVGESVTVIESNGNYEGADVSALDTAIATVALAGSDGTNASGVSLTPATSLTDGTYVIVNKRANKLVNNTDASAAAGAGTMKGLSLTGTTSAFDASTAVWTITAVDGGYTVQDANGLYMTISSNNAAVVETESVIDIQYNGSTWILGQNGAWLNDAAGLGTTASGWQDSTASTDVGSLFELYAYSTEQGGACTDVTFTGVYPGTTSVIVGRTEYVVTVTGDVIAVELEVGGTASYTIGDASALDVEPDASIASAEISAFAAAQLGTDATYSGEFVNLADCLYTFTANEDGTWTITANDAAVYLYPGHTTSAGYPNADACPVGLAISAGYEEGSFHIYSSITDRNNGDGAYLYFDRSSLRWDRVSTFNSNTTWMTNCSLYLYRATENGYEQVTALEDVTAGEYLIGAPGSDGNSYVLYPTTSTATRYSQIGKVGEAAAVTFTGVAVGETTARVGSTIFEITVTAPAHVHEYDAVVTDPTCTEGGYTTYTCACDDSYVADETEALGHDYVDGACTRCGEADPDYVPEAEVIASGWSGYTTWTLTDTGVLTFTPSGQLENGQCNLRNYWKVDGVLTLPWGEYAEMITTVVIEDGIHDIGQMAFYELPNLTTVELGADVVEVRNYAFKNCKALTTINLDTVENICEGAFYGCSALTDVTFAEGVTIADWAFTKSGVTLN